MRVVPITIRESKGYLVQYEKLPVFFYVCGLMGHELTERGDGVHEINNCQWGDWLVVKFRPCILMQATNPEEVKEVQRGSKRRKWRACSSSL